MSLNNIFTSKQFALGLAAGISVSMFSSWLKSRDHSAPQETEQSEAPVPKAPESGENADQKPSDSAHQKPSPEALLEFVKSHRSIRKFKDKDVSPETVFKIIDTASHCSSNGNMQPYSIVVSRDQKARDYLALLHDHSNISRCPVVLSFVADWTRMERWCELKDAKPAYNNLNGFLTAALDVMITSQSVAFCAEALGLGICYLGSTIWETEKLNDFLELPPNTHIVTTLMLGYPDESPAERARLPTSALIHEEKYTPMSNDEVLAFYSQREIEGWVRYQSLYGQKKWSKKLKEHNITNLAQVYSVLKYSAPDYRLWSRRQLLTLSKQGFDQNDPVGDDLEPCKDCGKMSHALDPARLE